MIRLIEYEFPYDELYLKPISDCHIGDIRFNEDKLQKDVDWISEKENRVTFLNGDIMNCATIRSISNTYQSDLTPRQELHYSRRVFNPIADSVLFINEGNHERRISKDVSIDPSEELAFTLGCHYGKEGTFIKLKVGKKKPQIYTLYASHGFTGSRTVGGKANRLEKLQQSFVVDAYVISHSHQQILFPKEIYVPDIRTNKVHKKEQMFINTGHYLKWGGYAETKAYPPSKLGSPTLIFSGTDHNISGIIGR